MVVRTSGLVPVRADTGLLAGDEVVILADPELRESLSALFFPHKDA
jgi:cell volume regulation protein A